jgi:hypothetical protein
MTQHQHTAAVNGSSAETVAGYVMTDFADKLLVMKSIHD